MLDMDRVKALAQILNERVFPEIRSDEEQFQRVKKMVEEEEAIEIPAEQDDTETFIPMSFAEAVQSKVWAAILQEDIYSRGTFASHIYHNLKHQDDEHMFYFKQDIISSFTQTFEQNIIAEDIEPIIYGRPHKSDGKLISNFKEGDKEFISPSPPSLSYA